MADGSDDDDVVGYKKPPKKHQFKKGHSGNKKGGVGKSKNMISLIDRELNQRITMTEGGVRMTLTKREAIVKRKVNAALNGSDKAMDYLIKYSLEHGAPDPFMVTEADHEAAKAALRRMQEEEAEAAAKAATDEDESSPKLLSSPNQTEDGQ